MYSEPEYSIGDSVFFLNQIIRQGIVVGLKVKRVKSKALNYYDLRHGLDEEEFDVSLNVPEDQVFRKENDLLDSLKKKSLEQRSPFIVLWLESRCHIKSTKESLKNAVNDLGLKVEYLKKDSSYGKLFHEIIDSKDSREIESRLFKMVQIIELEACKQKESYLTSESINYSHPVFLPEQLFEFYLFIVEKFDLHNSIERVTEELKKSIGLKQKKVLIDLNRHHPIKLSIPKEFNLNSPTDDSGIYSIENKPFSFIVHKKNENCSNPYYVQAYYVPDKLEKKHEERLALLRYRINKYLS